MWLLFEFKNPLVLQHYGERAEDKVPRFDLKQEYCIQEAWLESILALRRFAYKWKAREVTEQYERQG